LIYLKIQRYGFYIIVNKFEEKTRANAAGALGNFVRNSVTLARDLIKHGALH